MKKIIENFEILRTGNSKKGWQSPVLSSVLEQDTKAPIVPCGFGIINEYILSVEIGVKFHCNEAQLNIATEEARKTLVARLFGEALCVVQEIRSATLNNDEKRIIELCADLEKLLSAAD